MEIIHTPVLLEPCLQYLSPLGEKYENSAWMVDCTLGEGGHSEAFLLREESVIISLEFFLEII